MNILKTINFDEKYFNLSKKYPRYDMKYNFNIDRIKEMIYQLGYKARYYKSENFIKINLGDYDKYNICCHLIIYNNINLIDAGIYINENKTYIAGSLFRIMYNEVTNNENITKLYFKDEKEMESLIEDIIILAEEFKKGFESIRNPVF